MPINCLQCVRCQLRPDTDMTSPLAAIHCGKRGERWPLILSDCGIANPELHKTHYHEAGDRSFYMTDAEREYLRVWFPCGDEKRLCHVLRRPWREILRRVRRNTNFKRAPELVAANIRKGTAAARSQVKAPRFNDAQRAYIAARFASGPWPTQGNAPGRDAIRAEIVREVARLGHPFSWDSILSHAHETQPGAQKWRKRWDAQKRRTGKFVAKEAS